MEIVGNIIIGIGIIFMVFGIIGIFKYKNFYVRILVASTIDTMGALTVVVGIAIRHGFSFFSLRILLMVVLMFIINPMVTHIVARSAHESGFSLENNENQEEDLES